jgi:hypothetical protein
MINDVDLANAGIPMDAFILAIGRMGRGMDMV